MLSFISILRGINVSGQKKIKMADLRKLYEDLGFEHVETYIQSGNVVFTSTEMDPKKLEQLIFEGIQKAYGFDVPNLILTPQEITEALEQNPFQDIEQLYFTFLEDFPNEENRTKLSTYQFPEEYYELKGKVIYSHFPNGAGRAKMNNNFFEQKLKVMATTRNLNTVKKLLEMSKFIAK